MMEWLALVFLLILFPIDRYKMSKNKIWDWMVTSYGKKIPNLGVPDNIGWVICLNSEGEVKVKDNGILYYLLDDGLYMRPLVFPFKMAHIFIPWGDIETTRNIHNLYSFKLVMLKIKGFGVVLGVPDYLVSKDQWKAPVANGKH